MNESFLNRKFFSKLKGTKPSNQSLSSTTDSTAPKEPDSAQGSHRADDDDDHHQVEPVRQSSPAAEANSRGDKIRDEEDAEDAAEPVSQVAASRDSGSLSPQESQPSTSSSNNDQQSADANHQDNLLFVNDHPQQHNKKSSKLTSKSRAVWLFIRAASTLTSPSSSSSAAAAATPIGHQQNDTTTGSLGSSSRRGRRFGSLAPRMHHSNSCTTSASNLNNSNGANNEETSATTCLPRFIVPKMNALNLPIVCLVKSLEGELMREVFVHRYELGQYLIDSLKVSLGIKDSKYFGLKMAKSLEDQEDVRQPWLDLNESVCKQISKHKLPTLNLNAGQANNNNNSNSHSTNNNHHPQQQQTVKSICFYLRIKFYPPNLARIQDAFLRRYLWLQLRRDLRLGKLTSSMNNLTLLMACVLQHELGDYSSQLIERLPELNILPNQDLIEEQAIEIWKTKLMNSKKHQVLMQFLRAAIILETYGFDYYPVRDHQRQRAYLLGFNYNGIKTIRNGRIIHHFRWHNLNKISYERRMIIFHIYPTENSKRKQILGFKCLSNDDCQNLYMRLLEQKYFFTVDLTYFDKSVRRPSCLEPSQSAINLDWSSVGQNDEQQRQQQHLQHQFGSNSNSVGDFNTAQGHLGDGSFDQDVELEPQMNDDDYDEMDGEINGDHCDCDDYNVGGGHYGDQRRASNWPAANSNQFQVLQQQPQPRASFSKQPTVANNSEMQVAESQHNHQHRPTSLPPMAPIPGNQMALDCGACEPATASDGARQYGASRSFIKSSSLQEQSSSNPLGPQPESNRVACLPAHQPTLFPSCPIGSPPTGEHLYSPQLELPEPPPPPPPPAPHRLNHQQLARPGADGMRDARHHHNHHQTELETKPTLQRQHSTLVYASAFIKQPLTYSSGQPSNWERSASDDYQSGHQNANSSPDSSDQIDPLDKNNPPVQGARQQSLCHEPMGASAIAGTSISSSSSSSQQANASNLLENLLSCLLVPCGTSMNSPAEVPVGLGQQREPFQQQNSFIMLAIRFCLMILLMNFLLRITDNLSGALIELLTLPGGPHDQQQQHQHQSGSGGSASNAN